MKLETKVKLGQYFTLERLLDFITENIKPKYNEKSYDSSWWNRWIYTLFR